MKQSVFYIFTRTPLHIGAGSSVGAIDQPVQRERHTGFPVIPGSSIKGVLRDSFQEDKTATTWLFGSDKPENPSAGAIQCGEARLLAFPVRSVTNSFAWITSPLIMNRFQRDTGITGFDIPENLASDSGLFPAQGKLALNQKAVILEDYTIKHAGELPNGLAETFASLLKEDPVWASVKDRLIVVSDDLMTHFAVTACEVAQHIKIDDTTGTVARGALFNQENVPGETLFYGLINFFRERMSGKETEGKARREATEAGKALYERLSGLQNVLQLGADAGTGLGYCSVSLQEVKS